MMAVRRSDIALGTLALLSLAALVFQGTATPAPAPKAGASSPSGRQALPRLRPANAPPAPVPADLPTCQSRLVAVQAEIAGLDRRIERHRNPMEVFDRGQPNPPLTAEVASALRRTVGGTTGGALPVELQCRAQVCCAKAPDADSIKRFVEPAVEAFRDQRRLQGGGLGWRGPREACFRLRPPAAPAEAFDLVSDAVTRFRKSGAVERCQQRFAADGTLETRINLVGDEGDLEDAPLGLSVRIGGKLAGTPLGDCIAADLKRVLDDLRLPAEYESGVVFATFPNPPP
jgi:hypothetical protein